MIGFQSELKGEAPEPDEGPDTKTLSKRQLYDQLNKTYKLPPLNGRNVNRKYLLKVYRNQVYRVTNREYKYFEVELTQERLKKAVSLNSALVVKKLNILLGVKGEHELGFTQQNLPETDWLVQVAKYIDPTNILELFESPVRVEPPPEIGGPTLSLIYNGRKHAAEYIFRTKEVKESREMWEALVNVNDTYRYYQALQIGVELMDEDLKVTTKKMRATEQTLNDLVSKVAQTFTCMESPDIRSQMILRGGTDGLSQAQRDNLINNARL